jgi:hypothetical protein
LKTCSYNAREEFSFFEQKLKLLSKFQIRVVSLPKKKMFGNKISRFLLVVVIKTNKQTNKQTPRYSSVLISSWHKRPAIAAHLNNEHEQCELQHQKN